MGSQGVNAKEGRGVGKKQAMREENVKKWKDG